LCQCFSIDRIHLQGLSPHKFTPMPGVHQDLQPTANRRG
jgi:hypothetical protein